MTTTTDPSAHDPGTAGRSGRVDGGFIAVAIISILALTFSFVGLVTSDSDDGVEAGGGGGQTTVALSEFALSPAAVQVAEGGSLLVTNEGSQVHNLAVKDTDLVTADLAGGESETLDVSSLEAGEYEILCLIAGHAAAGMTGTLTVGGSGPGGSGDGHEGEEPDWAAMDAAMSNSILEFPAETEGIGNVPLEPEILADGTKHFELTASIVEWEVEPGKFVEAWAYNGMVPGPWIKVDVGDTIQVHIQNDLPMGTDIHWHGVGTPNDQDGVAPLTQPLIEAGTDYTYRFTPDHQALGMYHAHHHGQMQVPNGMLGIIQVGDVPLPAGRTISGTTIPENISELIVREYPMVLNDAGTIGLSLNGKSFPATEPLVVNTGDWVLAHYANEGLQIHPMHQHQFPQLVVAKDGIPLDNPYWADTVNVAPGERYSVLIHADDPGAWVWHCHILNHVEAEDGMFGMVTAIIAQ